MKYTLTALFFSVLTCCYPQQKVGLVLSGGAAKGLAHIGVLKALEENDIRIDYIVGTSMGAIIGGSYAAGMSPAQLEELVLSEDFLMWIKGGSAEGLNYYYYQGKQDPGFVKINLALDSTLNFQFNSTIANDLSLNFVLAELTAPAVSVCRGDFDSLFVPLRVVTADVFTQSEVVIGKGNLSDAIRASQSVPFFYSPTKIDGRYLFDGGVYNNFPVDVMMDTFHPDVVIGSNVSTKIFNEYPEGKDESLISHSLIFLLLDKSDPKSLRDSDVYIQPNIQGYTSFDFKYAKSLIDSGYVQTLRQLDEIKNKVETRMPVAEVEALRRGFNARSKPLMYDNVSVGGFNSSQEKYIRRMVGFKKNSPSLMTHTQIKRGYYRLISEPYFSNVYPNILFDSTKESYELRLSKRPQKNFSIDFGGVIATRDVSSIYLGLNYYRFNHLLTHAHVGYQTGSFYKSVDADVRIDMPYFGQFYLRPFVVDNDWNFLEGEDLLQSTSVTILRRQNTKGGLELGFPAGSRFRVHAFFEGYRNVDRYSNEDVFVSTDILDILRVNGYRTGLSASHSSLNRKQYPSLGKSFSLTGSFFHADTEYTPGNTSSQTPYDKSKYHWFQLRVKAEQYFNRSSSYRPGYLFEAVVSDQPAFQNYRGTIINVPAYFPLMDSPTLILENFRSSNYLAAGLRNVLLLRHNLDLRLEAYAFKPLVTISRTPGNDAEMTTSDITEIFLAASAQLVHHSPIGPISLSANYYDDSQNQWGVFLHVGYLLFGSHSLQ